MREPFGATYERPALRGLLTRLREPRRFIQVLAGPRQTGKTTMARQALRSLDVPAHLASADEVGLRDPGWIAGQWELGRRLISGRKSALLVLDEVQKVPGWSETVKRLWDEDTESRTRLRVLILGSSPLLMQTGLSESLAGRFETLYVNHWSYSEMREAFGWNLDRFLFYGGYPGAVPLARDPERWARYVTESLIETTISRDILLMTRVNKPALLRQLFHLACEYSGQILSFQKMLGQLQDAGNTVTLAHYLRLLEGSGLVAGVQKYSGSKVRRRASSPKLIALNNALITSQLQTSMSDARRDSELWGRLVESAVGASLLRTKPGKIFYWRERSREVDFVAEEEHGLLAIEITSGRRKTSLPGLAVFREMTGARPLLVGGQGLPLETFLRDEDLNAGRAHRGSGE
jgi:hypothetical protein